MASSADTSYKSTGGRLTKIPSIPEPPSDVSPSVKRFLAAVKETVEVREGKRGESLDRSIVVRDLLDPTFTHKYWPGGGSANPNTTPTPGQRDTTPPGPVTGLEIDTDGADSNVLSWNNPTDSDLELVEVRAVHIAAIPPWTTDMVSTIGDLVRYSPPNTSYDYVYECLVGNTGVAPDDPTHGVGGSDTEYWQREAYPYVTIRSSSSPLAVLTRPTGRTTWTHALSGTFLNYDWYYWVRALDAVGNASEWNPIGDGEGLLAIAKTTSMDVPTPTGLCICRTGSTDEFNDLDVHLCWNPSTNPLVLDYDIEILNVSGEIRRRLVKTNRGCSYTYAYGDNVTDGSGTPNDELIIRVWAVSRYGQRSDAYATITVSNPSPSPVDNLTAVSLMDGVQFEWDAPSDPDIDYYAYCFEVNGTRDPIDAEELYTTKSTSVTKYAAGGSAESPVTIRIYVQAVDTWGNWSTTEQAEDDTTPFVVEPTDIRDFPALAAKEFPGIPVVHGANWETNQPSATYVRWNTHRIYYKPPWDGVEDIDDYAAEEAYVYQISGSNCANASSSLQVYIYWTPDRFVSGSGTEDDPFIGASYLTVGDIAEVGDGYPPENPSVSYDPVFVIAINVNGSYTLAWNSQANMVIGSAYIMAASIGEAHIKNASINNAHIVNLDADKITGGVLETSDFDSNGGVQVTILEGGVEALQGILGLPIKTEHLWLMIFSGIIAQKH